MIKTSHVTGILCLTILLLFPGCQRKGQQSQPRDFNDVIVCPMFYQKNDSFINALKFIEVPKDRMDVSLSSVSKRGKLADKNQLAFANKLFSVRKSRDVDTFISLLSDGTKKHLDDDNSKTMGYHRLKEIKNGTFLSGEYDFKFFAIFREFTEKDLDTFKEHISFTETPTHVIHYLHFHKPNNMLIGSTFYLIESQDSYRIVMETLLHSELSSVSEQQKNSYPQK
jgi:hypothetical protein